MEQSEATKIEEDMIEEYDGPEWNPVDKMPELDKVQTKDEWILALKAIGWPDEPMFPFTVNRWGSCQYSTALSIYDLYFRIRENLSQEETLEVLGLEFSHNGVRDFDEAHQMLIDYTTDRYSKRDGHHLTDARRVNTFDEMFFIMKNWASDLWNSAPRVANFAFKDLKINAPSSPGKGPVGNIEVQSTNFTTGICCALLMDNNIVLNEKSFSGFDT